MLTSWSTTKPQLDAGRFMKAFVRVNVYLYSKPPTKIQHSINKFFLRMNIFLYRKSHGRVLGKFGSLNALLLTTLGRKTGKERTTPVAYLYDGGRFVVVAVPGHFDVPGGPKAAHPAWYLNLSAKPEATIDIGREQIAVTAEELYGDERDRCWRGFTDAYPFIGEFQNRAKRLLPIMRLTPDDLDPQHL
ncbi:nitroreductase family deazaflavin-dependent oxidoreductase [Actinomadura sp. HBU206391]|nr:nitroreductase family deazaflavin-dependent oxidoreductase [Actinomadura sp. HBU206391]